MRPCHTLLLLVLAPLALAAPELPRSCPIPDSTSGTAFTPDSILALVGTFRVTQVDIGPETPTTLALLIELQRGDRAGPTGAISENGVIVHPRTLVGTV